MPNLSERLVRRNQQLKVLNMSDGLALDGQPNFPRVKPSSDRRDLP